MRTKEKVSEYNKTYAVSRKEQRAAYNRAYWLTHPHSEEALQKKRTWALFKLYGLTEAAFAALYDAQGGRCAICGTSEWGGPTNKPKVDHDHETGKVRGLLCNHCNVGLGHFGDSPELMKEATAYLETHNGNSI